MIDDIDTSNADDRLVDTLLVELDRDLSRVDMYQRAAKARAIVKDWQTAHPEESLPDEVHWELCALEVTVVRNQPLSRESGPRFRPLWEWRNGYVYPDLANLMNDERVLEYFEKRATETINPIQRARYADFLWEALARLRAPDAFRFGVMAAEAYIRMASLCLAASEYLELVDALQRAAELSLLLNNKQLAQQVVIALVDALDKLPYEHSCQHKSRWALDLGGIILRYSESKFADLVCPSVLEELHNICLEGIAYYRAKDPRNLFILHDLMSLCSSFSHQLGDEEESWTWKVAIAESLEEEARQREATEGPTDGSLAALKFTEDALRLYQQLASQAPDDTERRRLQGNANELKLRTRRLLRQAEDELEHIRVTTEIPRKALEQIVTPFLQVEPDKVFDRLSGTPFLLPDINNLRQEAEEAAGQYIFANFFSQISLRNGRKVDEIPAFEGEAVHLQQQLDGWFQFHWQILDYILHRLKQAGRFTATGFLRHVLDWEYIDERDVPFIEAGLERYFAEDYISTVHILAPRVEHMLKGAFEQAGLSLLVIPNIRQIREQTLGDFLHREEVRKVLGESVWTYLDYALVDERGLNLRNEVAHGWISSPGCNRFSAQILLFIILLLTRLQSKEPSSFSESDQ